MSDQDNKRFYWLKLNKNFFQRHDIRIIENLPNGKDYVLFYLKLMCESTSHEGELRFSEYIPYSEEMLSTITNTNVDIVRQAVKMLTDLQLLEILDDGTIYLNEVAKLIGSETGNARRLKEYRKSRKSSNEQLVCSNEQIKCSNEQKCNLEIDIEKDIDIDKEIYKENILKHKDISLKHKYGKYKNVLLTNEQLEKLKEEFPSDWGEWINRVDEYVASTGKHYKDYLATIRVWSKRDQVKPKQKMPTESIPEYNSSENIQISQDEIERMLRDRE